MNAILGYKTSAHPDQIMHTGAADQDLLCLLVGFSIKSEKLPFNTP